jgi:hypothetical protein
MRLLIIGLILLGAYTPAVASESCQPGLSSRALDYGAANRAELLQRKASTPHGASFGLRSVQLRIQCDAARVIKWSFVAPEAGAAQFRWAGGLLQMRIVAVRLDGAAVHWRTDGGESVEAGLLRPGQRIVAWRAGSGALGTLLEVDLEIEPQVSDATSRVGDRTRFESVGSFQLH